MKTVKSTKYTYRIVKIDALYYVQIMDSEGDWVIIGMGKDTQKESTSILRKYIDEDDGKLNIEPIDFEL